MADTINSYPHLEGTIFNSKNWSGESYNLGTLDANIVYDEKQKRTKFSVPVLKQNFSGLSTPNRIGPTEREKNKLLRQAKIQNFKNDAKAFGGKVNDFLGSEKGQGFIGAASSALDIAKGFIPTQESKGKNPTGFEAQQQIGDALTKVPISIVQAAGLAYKGISMLAEATDSNVNTITKEQADDLDIKGARIANNVIGTILPFAGRLNGGAVEEGRKSPLIDEMSNAYADTVADINQANVLGGGRYLFGKKKIENAVSEANRRNDLLTEMNMTNTMRKQSDYGRDLAQQNMNRYAGTNYMDMRMGRKGMKIQSLEEIRELLKNRVVAELDIQKFAEGGSLMPAGKLHKELSHINELGEQYEDLTRKGIPVVTLDEGGEIQQVAEVERDEWIWNLEFTQQIEALWKDGSEEAMIEAGKILTEELLRNTDDISGIIHKEDE